MGQDKMEQVAIEKPDLSNKAFEKDYSKYGFSDPEAPVFKSRKGLTKEIVEEISKMKNEPEWMLKFRLKSLEEFWKKSMPQWGGNLNTINFDDIYYYLKPVNKMGDTWDDVPETIKKTFEKLGIPEAERKFLSGVSAQYESEVVYHKVREDLEKQNVIFLDMDSGLREHEDLVKKYFGTVIPYNDNKFAALNSAVWSGGSFIYVPKGVKVELPLQAYFRINAKNMGQFERTLIIADEGSSVSYVEGCFVKGTPIQTIKGNKPIEEIEANDIVLTHNLNYQRVYRTQKRKYAGNLYTIQYNTDSRHKIKITEEHPILASPKKRKEYKNTSWETEWISPKNLKAGDYVVMPIDRTVLSKEERLFTIKFGRGKSGLNDIDVLLKTDKDFFRLAGYYLAEGSVSSDHYLNFTFNKNERQYIDDVKDLLHNIFGKEPLEYPEYKNGISLVLCSTAAARIFKQQFGHGANNKSLPLWMIYESIEKQKELVKGWFRGDGSAMSKRYAWGRKSMFRISTASSKLAEHFKTILLRLNIIASINVWKRKEPRHDLNVIYVGGSYFERFADMMGIKISVNANSGKSQLTTLELVSYGHIDGDYAFVPIRKITSEHVENIDVYNFSVENDESYVSHGILVHNCTAPTYSTDSLHSAVVELIAMPGSRLRYTTIQNWSSNVYNLVTKRAFAYKDATVEWIDGNLGSKLTMKYPSIYLLGERARGDIISVAFAGKGQHQDAGGKIIHAAPNTTSLITSKSISKDGGKTTYRGLLKVFPGAINVKSKVSCDALILDDKSSSDTVPYMEISEKKVDIGHEASVGKISEEKLFYLMSRGLSQQEAIGMIVSGFIEPFVKELPMEYAVELNRLIQLQMEGSVG